MTPETFVRYRRLVLGGAALVGFALAWEVLLSTVRWDPFFITKPSLIAPAVREQIFGGRLWHDIAVSAQAFVGGVALAVVVGIPVGMVMGWRRRAEWALDPLLSLRLTFSVKAVETRLTRWRPEAAKTF